MVYLDPDSMTREKRDALLEWIVEEGLSPASIANDGRFSVHNGRISGNRFVFAFTGDDPERGLVWQKGAVKQHFNVQQKNPLPKELIP